VTEEAQRWQTILSLNEELANAKRDIQDMIYQLELANHRNEELNTQLETIKRIRVREEARGVRECGLFHSVQFEPELEAARATIAELHARIETITTINQLVGKRDDPPAVTITTTGGATSTP
jgi:acyl transferase domain-containing protein